MRGRAGSPRLAVACALCLACVACTPEIASGAYLCGPDALCPKGQVCDGPDNVCVLEGLARPFSCGTAADPAGDDQPATGTSLAGFACTSVPREIRACLSASDGADFFQLDVPAGCAGARLQGAATFAIAFQPLDLVLSTAGGAPAPAEAPCPPAVTATAGDDVRCLDQPAAAGSHLAVGVIPAAGDACGGACRFNRYTLRLWLALP